MVTQIVILILLHCTCFNDHSFSPILKGKENFCRLTNLGIESKNLTSPLDFLSLLRFSNEHNQEMDMNALLPIHEGQVIRTFDLVRAVISLSD